MVQIKNKLCTDLKLQESIKFIRTNITSLLGNNKTMTFTSMLPKEGKTFISFKTAISLAEINKKVLYIDFNLKNENLYSDKFYDIKENGIVDFLKSDVILENIILETSIKNLYIIPSGNFQKYDNIEILEDKILEMLKKLKENFDYIIIDTPNLSEFSDSIILSKLSDGVVLVNQLEVVPKDKFIEIKNILDLNKCNLIGTIINKY